MIPGGRCTMDFGARMKMLRLEKKMLQKELAGILKVSVGTVCNYEKNVHFPGENTLCQIADEFGVSVDYLLGRTDCRSSLDALNKDITPGFSLADLVNKIVLLDSQGQKEVRQYTEYLESIRKKQTSSGT